jgi:hypothetical protein
LDNVREQKADYNQMLTAALATAVVLFVPTLWLGNQLRHGLAELWRVMPLIREFGKVLLGFAAAYVVICLLFATWYWCLHEANEESFTGAAIPPPGHQWERFITFFYFAVVTLLTMGYSDILPNTPWARTLMSAQFIVGLAWTTVFFAFMMTHLQRVLDKKTSPQLGGDAGKAIS